MFVDISIHALREEGDEQRDDAADDVMRFLSTPSARRATAAVLVVVDEAVISIHALREEGDFMPSPLRSVFRLFLSTPSARRATFLRVWSLSIVLSNFYPRPPRGGRLTDLGADVDNAQFLSTPSARRATPKVTSKTGWEVDFYPRPPRGGRPEHEEFKRRLEEISIHALREEGDEDDESLRKRVQEFLSTPSARRATR